MVTEKILYTDGSSVVITDSTLRVRNRQYRLAGIVRHNFSIVKPNRIPGIFTIGIGLIALTIAGNANPSVSDATLQLGSTILESRVLLFVAGALAIVTGIFSLITLKEKYAVHIVTGQGEMDVLVSDRREYVAMVVEALNKAFINTLAPETTDDMRPMGMSVSHR